jgi:hypothetical protein
MDPIVLLLLQTLIKAAPGAIAWILERAGIVSPGDGAAAAVKIGRVADAMTHNPMDKVKRPRGKVKCAVCGGMLIDGCTCLPPEYQ